MLTQGLLFLGFTGLFTVVLVTAYHLGRRDG